MSGFQDCYWVEERGCYELCGTGAQPALPGDYVVWDNTPEVLAGRTISATFPRGANWIELVASPDIIVMGESSNWGGTDTDKSYTVIVSDDHGFTFSGGIDKYPFVDGSAVGYLATYNDAQWQQYFGTAVTYDDVGGEFFAMDSTMNDQSINVAQLRTSRSTDGVSWTTEQVVDINYCAVWCAAYAGTVWYIGYNDVEFFAEYPSAGLDEKMCIRASDDGGATWQGQLFGDGSTYVPWSYISKELTNCSANAQGLHVINEAWNDTQTDMYYIRPLTKTTWATPYKLFLDTYHSQIHMGHSDFIIASRCRPGEIYIGFASGDSYPDYPVKYRRSADNGATWGAVTTAWIGTDAYTLDFTNQGTFNGIRVVELDDGRLVLITLGWHDASQKRLYAYAVNTDGLATAFGATTILQEGGLDVTTTQFANYTPRFEATNKGNDVVIAWCNNSPGSGDDLQRSLVFRP